MALKETGRFGADWINTTKNSVQSRGLVNTEINYQST
jgi:hypothetical protein